MVNKTISEMIMLLHIPYYLDTVLSHVFHDLSVCAYWVSQVLQYPTLRTYSE